MEDQLASRGGGVYGLLKAFESYLSLFELSHQLDEVFEGAPEAVQSPDGEDVSFPQNLPCLIHPRPGSLRSADFIDKYLLAASQLEGIFLEV